MKLCEMIEVMQHFENGGDVEVYKTGRWTIAVNPIWDWDNFEYRIKEPKQKVTIEKWLCKSGENSFYIHEGTDADGLEKVKLLDTYEVEL